MTARFVLEESSWATATKSEVGVLSEAIEELLDRLDTTRERSEVVVKHHAYLETALGDDVQLFSVLYERSCRVQLDRDLTERLSIALDRIDEFNESELVACKSRVRGKDPVLPRGGMGTRLVLSETSDSSPAATTWLRAPWPSTSHCEEEDYEGLLRDQRVRACRLLPASHHAGKRQ